MKRLLLAPLIILFAVVTHGQVTSQRVVYTTANPPTVCTPGKIYTNSVAQKSWLGASDTSCKPHAMGTAGTVTTSGSPASPQLAKFSSSTAIATATAVDVSTPLFCSDAGANDTYACSLAPTPTLVTGTHYRFKANTANTGAATINFNSIGAKTIKKAAGGLTTDLADNDIRAGQWVDLVYDGTNMEMQSTLGNAGGSSLPTQTSNAGKLLTTDGTTASWANPSTSLLDSLIGSWSLNEASGTRADSTANADTLTDNATVTSATGVLSLAGQFTRANSEYLSHANNSTLSMGDINFTISVWVYLDSTGNDMQIVAKDDAGQREYAVNFNTSATTFQFWVFDSGSGSASVTGIVPTAAGTVATSTWYHIVAWRDKTRGTINLQVDQVDPTSRAALIGKVSSASDGALVVNDSTTEFRLGARGFGGSEQFFDGRIDQVNIYKRLLTAAERHNLFNDGIALAYPFQP